MHGSYFEQPECARTALAADDASASGCSIAGRLRASRTVDPSRPLIEPDAVHRTGSVHCTMPDRGVASLLAVVLLWSGLSAIQAPRAFTQFPPEQRHAFVHAIGQGAVHEGSVEHHYRDDLPAQMQNDPFAQAPDLLPPPLMSGAPALAIVRPRSPTTAAVASPALAGPLRPPSSAALIG